jgi:hypothetical protein
MIKMAAIFYPQHPIYSPAKSGKGNHRNAVHFVIPNIRYPSLPKAEKEIIKMAVISIRNIL